jgi:enterochelin esterase family protein
MRKARRLLVATILLSTIAVGSQQSDKVPESSLVAAVRRDLTAGNAAGNAAAQDEFWKTVEQKKAPLIENIPGSENEVLVTFVWKDSGETKKVIVYAGVNGLDPESDPRCQMQRLPGTNIWYLSHRLPRDAEILYQLIVNPPEASAGQAVQGLQRSARPDPLNPVQYPDRLDPLFDPTQPWRTGSIARMPAVAENPWLSRQSDTPAGALREHTVKSAFLKMANPRNVWVYTSPGAELQKPNVLILFDGGTTYQNRIPTTAILDNLYAAHKIGQTIAIFVDNGGPVRSQDMYFNDAFVKFLTDELLPWAQQEFKFKADPSRTALGGDSLCGLIGAYAALRRPDVFGKVLAQSGAFQLRNVNDADKDEPEWLARQFARAAKSNVVFCLEAGRMENRPNGNDGTTLLASNRHLRDVLRARGYVVHYFEVYGDHDPVHWRRTLPEALMVVLGS